MKFEYFKMIFNNDKYKNILKKTLVNICFTKKKNKMEK